MPPTRLPHTSFLVKRSRMPSRQLLPKCPGTFSQHRCFSFHPSLQSLATSASRFQYFVRENLPPDDGVGKDISASGKRRFRDFDLTGGVYIVTGSAQGLGLSLAEGIAEAGGTVYGLDRQDECGTDFSTAVQQIPSTSRGSMVYGQADVNDTKTLHSTIAAIADRHGQLNGCIAAAGINEVIPALQTTVEDSQRTMSINFDGVMQTALASAKAIYRHHTRDASIVLIASMSGLVANRGLDCSVYNASKAAVTQLARNLAMEWGRPDGKVDGATDTGAIRVNCISPGNILTPRVEQHFREKPELRRMWEDGNMLGRVSRAEEFRGAGIFLLSRASSFMTGQNLVIDGGYTAW